MSNHRKESLEIIREYLGKTIPANGWRYYIKTDIPERVFNNAVKAFASGAERSKALGFIDTTMFGSGKTGFLFSEDKLYFLEAFGKPHKVWYDDIKSVTIVKEEKKDTERELKLRLFDGEEIQILDSVIKKNVFKQLLEKLRDCENNTEAESTVKRTTRNNAGATAAGLNAGAYHTVNHLYDEEKFHAQQGHGFAAERANNLHDRYTGRDAKIVGDDNAKNGPDRIVDGIYIQSKYCATGTRSINDCFESNGQGAFRYMIDGRPMQIEVPSDQYQEALRVMENKIRNGQIEGVTNPEEAKNIVRKGNFTYAQARNIARAGTVESLTYDAANGAVIAGSAFGVTAMITFATSIWGGEDFDVALKNATYSGLKVGGTAFITSILASQLSKAGLNSALVKSSQNIINMMGPKASAVLANAFRAGSEPLSGATAMSSAAKLLRGNSITAGVSFVILSSVDIANLFTGCISGKQLFKNMLNTGATVSGGTGGWMAGAAAGSTVMPGPGTVIGGFIGAMVAGTVASKATNKVVGKFIEDDADKMVKIIQDVFTELSSEYLLNAKEAEKAVDKLKDKLDGKTLKDMFASKNEQYFARTLLRPIIENEVSKRKAVHKVTNEQMIRSMRTVLEEIADINSMNGGTAVY